MNAEDIKKQKSEIRKEMKNRLSEFVVDTNGFSKKSAAACLHLLNAEQYKTCNLLLCFISLKDEINTDLIIKTALQEGKKVAVPRVSSATEMDFYLLNNDLPLENQIVKGAFGILEPDKSLEKLCVDCIKEVKALIVLPGLAFSMTGERLGKGRGYYDRYLSRIGEQSACPLIGFCFDFQIVDEIPSEKTDRKVNHLITESGLKF